MFKQVKRWEQVLSTETICDQCGNVMNPRYFNSFVRVDIPQRLEQNIVMEDAKVLHFCNKGCLADYVKENY